MEIIAVFLTYVSSRLTRTERAASLVEYALLVALIAVVCIGAVTVLGTTASTKFSKIGSAVGS
jgi:pilus assembly protein Flp/PilA